MSYRDDALDLVDELFTGWRRHAVFLYLVLRVPLDTAVWIGYGHRGWPDPTREQMAYIAERWPQ